MNTRFPAKNPKNLNFSPNIVKNHKRIPKPKLNLGKKYLIHLTSKLDGDKNIELRFYSNVAFIQT